MLVYGCRLTCAMMVREAISEQPANNQLALWLRMQGYSYAHISRVIGTNKGQVWRTINGPVRRAIYSLIEHSVAAL